jgi:hypothetical protein
MMDSIGVFFIVFVALATVLANIGIWAPRKIWVRYSAVAVAALFMPAAYASVTDLLSRPKPASIEWLHRNTAEATVLSASIVENKSIYLWLQLSGETEPRAYVLPYDKKLARQLHEAQKNAKRKGTKTRMKRPFAKQRDNNKRQFYAAPQPPRPKKSTPNNLPHVVVPPARQG